MPVSEAVYHLRIPSISRRSSSSGTSAKTYLVLRASAKLCGLVLRGGDLTLALNTRYVFAGVPEELDLRDIDGIRKWFTASLTGMGNLLDLITESPALTGAAE